MASISFRDSKIVISLFNDSFNEPFDEGFIRKLLCKDMNNEVLGGMSAPVNSTELAKLAIRNCDGVIINDNDVSPELIEYAKAQGKAILPQEAIKESENSCYEFYNSLFE